MKDKEIRFLKELLMASMEEETKSLSPFKVEIDKLKNFDTTIAAKFLKIEVNVLPKEHFGYKVPPSNIGLTGQLIQYSPDKKSILFYYSVIKRYLKTLEK